MLRLALGAVALFVWQLAAADTITVTTANQAHQPVAGVRVELRAAQHTVASADTDAQGHAAFTTVPAAPYSITAAKPEFQTVEIHDLHGPVSLDVTMVPALAHTDSIDVAATATPLDQTPPSSTVEAPVARELPGRPSTVSDALPLLPGVVRTPGGGLALSAAGQHRSALIVNSADVTDPATGQFGLTVPIDSVETLNFYQTPFLAEYGKFTAGLVSVETRRGGEKWKWDLNDPFPDFRIRSWKLRGLRDATPRLNLEGPLIAGKLYFSEGFEYQVRKTQVFELPFPFNQKKQQGINSFAQFDWIASGRQLVTATVHVAPQRLGYVNLNYFNPESTTPDASTQNYTATLADHWSLHAGVLENTLSMTRFDARVWGQGSQDLTITPTGNSGNYFAQQQRSAWRYSWMPVFSLSQVNWWGAHHFKLGSTMSASGDRGHVTDRPIDILDAAGRPLERIAFTPGLPFHNQDAEFSFFGQDHWMVGPHLAVDLGLRTESQAISESFRIAPRAAISWNPWSRTVVRAGFGWFYDRVPLNVYSFDSYPSQVVTMFDPGSQIASGPFVYQNGLGTVNAASPFVFQEMSAGNFSPRSTNGSLQVEQTINDRLKLRVGYMRSQSSGLMILNAAAPDPVTHIGAYLLSGGGQSRYRQFETTARFRVNEKGQLFFSYVRAGARGDLNDFANYLGSFPVPVIRPNLFGNLPADLPNRFLAWGMIQLPQGFRIAPLMEIRSGFPYAVTDAAQNYVGVPNANRFPAFLSLDARFSKDFKVNAKYTVRFSVSSFNLTNHFNPEALHPNVADPAYGLFFGQRGRHFTADFDVLF